MKKKTVRRVVLAGGVVLGIFYLLPVWAKVLSILLALGIGTLFIWEKHNPCYTPPNSMIPRFSNRFKKRK